MKDAAEIKNSNWFRYFGAIGGVAFVTVVLMLFRDGISPTAVALSLVLVVLFAATFAGRNPALIAAFIGVLCFNYFFLPPFGTFIIADSQNWIAWAAFMVTALVAGELSAYARRRAEDATRSKKETEKLYLELQNAFAEASRTEAIRQSEKLKSALLDAVTHDLRTPLTSIKAAATALIDDERETTNFRLDREGKREFLEIIDEESDRLNRFIEGMVELARIEAGAIGERKIWNQAGEIINAALERAANLLKNHNVKSEIETELPAVRVDAKALEEVVYTLLDNAAKYSERNTNIIIAARYAPPEMIEISVADEGRGVSPEMRERVFEKFFRVEHAANETKTTGGIGLGLAIARGIVEAHGGRIRILDGANGRGAKFTFTVPVGDEE